jgi:hypothetical protein
MPALVTPGTHTGIKEGFWELRRVPFSSKAKRNKKRAPNKAGALKKMQFETITL